MITKDDFIKRCTSGKPTKDDQVKKASTEDNDVPSQNNDIPILDMNDPLTKRVLMRGMMAEMSDIKKAIMSELNLKVDKITKEEVLQELKLLSSIFKMEEWAIKGLSQKN